METEFFHVLDSRAGFLAMQNNAEDLTMLDDDWERFIMETGSAEDCCKECNKGTFGTLCVVANENGVIQWDWFQDDGTWKMNAVKE